MSAWAPLALTVVTAALLALPVTPALLELWRREDATPLPTTRHDGRIGNFAEIFRGRLEPFRPQLERCEAVGEVSRASAEGMEIMLVGASDFDFHPQTTEGVNALMLGQSAAIPAGRVVEADVYADGTLELGPGAALRAGLASSDIKLGENSSVLRWLHADGNVYLRRGSTAYGRLSAGESIGLERGCGFERMHAPRIFTVDGEDGMVSSRTHLRQNRADMGHLADDVLDSSRPRIRVQGNFVLPAGETLNANVIATGEVRVGAGARLLGSAKSYGDTVIAEDACVHGSIVCRETVRLGERSFVAGPVMAEGDVMIARGSRVGGPDALTTISSRGAQIAAGCQLHGTIWARVRGSVEG